MSPVPRARRAAGLLLAAALALTIPGLESRPAAALYCDPYDQICQQLDQGQQQQKAVQNQLQLIAANLADTQTKANETLVIVRRLEGQIAVQEKIVAATLRQLDRTNRDIRFTTADISRQVAQLTVRQQLLDQRVRALAALPSTDYVELLVTARGFTQFVDRLMLWRDVVRSDQSLVAQMKLQRDQVQILEERLQAQKLEQQTLLAQQQAQQAALDQQRASQQAALDYLQTLAVQYQQQQQQRQAELDALNAQVAQLQKQYDQEALSLGGGHGRFGWPIQAPISQGYGCSDLLFEWYNPDCPPPHTFHYGIDIAGLDGAPIAATDNGVVSLVSSSGCFGNHVVISHGNGFASWYAHLSGFAVQVGQPVHRGQVIAYEGSTGCSTGPHLHFGIWHDGGWVNPMPYLG